MDYKVIISAVVVFLTLIVYVVYVKDVLKNKTTPHTFTWFVWAFASGITYALQLSGGAGVGALVTLVVAIMCFLIFLLGLTKKNKDITRSDVVFLLLSLVALFLWLVIKQPLFAVVLIVAVDVFGFIPTIRKSWNNPYSETLIYYETNVFRHGLSIFALQEYNILTWLYPVAWMIANLIFTVILISRRASHKQKNRHSSGL